MNDGGEYLRPVFRIEKITSGLDMCLYPVTCTHKPEIGLTLCCREGLFRCSDTNIRKCNDCMTDVGILQALHDMHGMDARWEGWVFREHVMCLKEANRDLLKFVVV